MIDRGSSSILLVVWWYFSMAENTEHIFYGMQIEDSTVIRSSIDNSFETYRNSLGTMMTMMDKIFSETDKVEEVFENFFDIHAEWKEVCQLLPYCHERNEFVAYDLLLKNVPNFVLGLLNQPSYSYFPLPSEITTPSTSSYTSIHQLLIHLGRDWGGDSGEDIRKITYIDGILSALLTHSHHVTTAVDGADLTVLVPGAGMGRLAMEIAAAGGFNVEANECSGTMVYAMHAMLTSVLPRYAANSSDDIEYYPFLHFNLEDEWDFSNRMKPSRFPVPDARNILQWILDDGRGGRFSVQYGDFLNCYGDETKKETFDIIVTSFFMDTFANILEPLAVIQHILKAGGLWVNAGPLHYHKQAAIPYSYAQYEKIIMSLNFTKLHTSTINSHYYAESINFMKPQIYNFPLSVWKKNYAPPKNTEVEIIEPPSLLHKITIGKGN